MRALRLPQFQLLAETNLSEHYYHSLLISALRGLAAIEVVAAHLRAQFYPGLKGLVDPPLVYQALAFFTGFAHQAVVVFFLLSGWLVGGSLLNKRRQPGIMLSYTVDRLTRLWIVLIPVFLLSIVLGALTNTVDLTRFDLASGNEYSLSAFIGNLFGLQDMAVPRYGGNFALWSLANETWYYILFPILLVVLFGSRVRQKLLAGVLVLFIASSLNGDLMLYFSLWLLGMVFSRIRITASPAWLFAGLAMFLATAVYFRLTGSNDILVRASFVQDCLFSLAFLLVLSALQTPIKPLHRPTRLVQQAGASLAAFSFTLYVIHVPLLVFLKHQLTPYLAGATLAPERALDYAIYTGLLLTIIVLAWLFHLPFEAQTHRLRRKIKQSLRGWQAPARGPDPTPL